MKLRHICLEYPYAQLEEATDNFADSRRLGSGTAGTVYRAEMPDGSDTAVKVIDLSLLGEDSMVAGFEEEIAVLSKFRHPNLVVLMGWARKDSRRFLIYEFLSGGDIFQRLQKSRDASGKEFLWHERLSCARGAATGLAHLHNATPHAFHRDVKSANILLGGSGAKMADFGLSCVAKTQKDKEVDCKFPSGTPGYTCPTYIRSGKVTEGSEVYSFGMVMLELLLNQMPAGMMKGELVYPIQEIIQPAEPGAVERCIEYADPRARWPHAVSCDVAQLALACIHPDDAQRPRFNEVCKSLRAIQERYPAESDSSPSASLSPQKRASGLSSQAGSISASAASIPHGSTEMPSGPAGGKQPMSNQTASPPKAVDEAIRTIGDAGERGAWPEGADVAFEVAYVHGQSAASLPFSVRYPTFTPTVDTEGRRSVQLGRHCQPQWFEALLTDPELRNSISRVACEVCWGASGDSSTLRPGSTAAPATSSAPMLRTLGSNLLVVDKETVKKDQSCILTDGSEIRFMFQAWEVLLMLVVHATTVSWEKIGDATVVGESVEEAVRAAQRRPTVGAESDFAQLPSMRPSPQAELRVSRSRKEEIWLLELVFAVGLSPDAILRLPKARRTFCCTLYRGCPAVNFGRQNQMAMFEALLGDSNKELLCFVSREHLQFDIADDGAARVLNKSQNITFMGGQILQRGEAVKMTSGDTISFAAEAKMIAGAEAVAIVTGDGVRRELAPFITFRIVKTFD